MTITVSALFVATVALLWWPERRADQVARVDSKSADATQSSNRPAELYTCGMHPQVLSETPGTCPICQMELTPVRIGADQAQVDPAGAQRRIKYWRAPMDPSYVSDRPGKSPMGMDLVPVYEDETAAAEQTSGGVTVSISPVVVQNMGVRTVTVEKLPVVKLVRTIGTIDYDEKLVRDVTTKVEGWIEKLYADYTGQQIETGMPLYSVYSPQLYSSQEEYLLALRNQRAIKPGSLPQAGLHMRELIESARLRLRLFDIATEQIEALERRGQPAKTMTILSPHTGIVVEKNARDGMNIRPGMKLFTIADLSRVWVYVKVYENDLEFVKIGQDAAMSLSYLPGKEFRGKVVYVYPFVDTDTRTVKVRLEFDNPHLLLKPGMFADVTIDADLGRRAPQVPRAAVIDTGERQVAFVALGEGRFEPRAVRTGASVGSDSVEILSGLNEGEQVVTSGQFLLDSESKLREAVLKMIARERDVDSPQSAPPPIAQSAADRPHAQTEHEVGEPARHADAELTMLLPAITAAVESYLQLQEALAQDDVDSVAPHAASIRTSLDALSSAAAAGSSPGALEIRLLASDSTRIAVLIDGRSLDGARAYFGDLSRAIMRIVELAGSERLPLSLNAFHCPMAGGSWLQRDEVPRNPYYGFSMDRCGDPIGLGQPRSPQAATVPVPAKAADRPHAQMEHEVGEPARHADAELTMLLPAITTAVESYLQLQEALAQDDVDSVAPHAASIRTSLDALSSAAADGSTPVANEIRLLASDSTRIAALIDGRSLDGARAYFGDLSLDIMRIVELAGSERLPLSLNAFHCPMAGGSWLQRDELPRNPYYGFSMDRCGDPIGLDQPR